MKQNILMACVMWLMVVNVNKTLTSAELTMLGERRLPHAVSDEGDVIVGSSLDGNGWSWTPSDGSSTFNRVSLNAISGDGSVIGGHSGGVAIRWTVNGEPIPLGLPGDEFSRVEDVSADGNVLVGQSSTSPTVSGFRWTMEVGLEPLEPLAGNNISVSIYSVSEDGSVIVGASRYRESADFEFESEATVWRLDNEFQPGGLGKWNGLNTYAALVSRDGSTIIGGIGPDGGHHGQWPFGTEEIFRWTEETGLVSLGTLEGTVANTPRAMTGDASFIVGNTDVNSRNFMWDEVHGFRDLQPMLEDEHGITGLTDQFWVRISDMTADARTLIGNLRRCTNCQIEGWALFLDRPLHWILGDADHDFDVDFADFLTLSNNFGEAGDWEDGDFDLNGTVEFADFLALSENFNIQPIPASAPVPEPAAASFLGLALLTFIRISMHKSRSPGRRTNQASSP